MEYNWGVKGMQWGYDGFIKGYSTAGQVIHIYTTVYTYSILLCIEPPFAHDPNSKPINHISHKIYTLYLIISSSAEIFHIIWVNSNISLSWIKAIWGWFPKINKHDFQWGHGELTKPQQKAAEMHRKSRSHLTMGSMNCGFNGRRVPAMGDSMEDSIGT